MFMSFENVFLQKSINTVVSNTFSKTGENTDTKPGRASMEFSQYYLSTCIFHISVSFPANIIWPYENR